MGRLRLVACEKRVAVHAGDVVALELQEFFRRRSVDTRMGLLRIDYRREAAQAPFRFDMVGGKLHRPGCCAIPETSLPALYSVWDPGADLCALACQTCRPMPVKAAEVKQDPSLDFLYGLLSVVDQFGSVLKERGREYRSSARGRQVSEDLSGMLAALDATQREALNATLSSLDGVIKAIQQVNENVERQTESNNGRHRNGRQRDDRK